jgi:Fe-Mn family superoxide dismutase
MVTRRNFVQTSAAGVAGIAMTALNAPDAKAQSRAAQLDRLTDESGKYAVAPLPFAYDALEPVIDAKTV